MPVLHRLPALFLAAVCLASAAEVQTPASPFRAVILLIGDGFDDQHVTMARNYLKGHDGQLLVDTLPVRSAVQVETVDANSTPVYVADSANTATTLATGVVTDIGRIGTDIEDRDVPTVLELAHEAGYRTGIVSTASITDATPASFLTHVAQRGCEDPQSILPGERYGVAYAGCPEDRSVNGGRGSIAEQIAASPVDIILGGGLTRFQVTDDETGVDSLTRARNHGFSVIHDLAAMPASSQQPVLGLFANKHLPVRMRGTNGRSAEPAETSLLHAVDDRLGSVNQPEPMSCEPNPDFAGTPSLAAMTGAALTHLSRDNPKGFFLMVESASIDKQSHARNPCGSIGEVEQLEEALDIALDYAGLHPGTLILVTADHAQAAQIVPEPSLFHRLPIPIYSPGKVARLQTPEGSVMRINYATNNFSSSEHTGANVPLFANATGVGLVSPFLRQRGVHGVMQAFLGLDSTPDASPNTSPDTSPDNTLDRTTEPTP